MDYFQARYYSSSQGRFTSPDEFTGGPDELFDFVDDAADNPTLYADLTNPQSLNKYQYAYNNPLRYVDPDGHDVDDSSSGDDCCDGAKGASIPVPPLPFRPLTPQEVQATTEALRQLGNTVNGLIDSAVNSARNQIVTTGVAVTSSVTALGQTLGILPQPATQPQTGTPPSQQTQPAPHHRPCRQGGGKIK